MLPLIAYGRRWFNAPALVIGSLAPDFPYFLFCGVERKETHNLHGVLVYCLPAGLIAWWLYQYLLRPALWQVFSLRQQVPENGTPFPWWRTLLVVAFSLWLGAATHIFWDGFTHVSGWASQKYPLLRENVWPGHHLPLSRQLQYLSGVLGTAAVFWYWHRFLVQRGLLAWDDAPQRRLFCRRVLGITVASVVLGLLIGIIYLHFTREHWSAPYWHLLLRFTVICATDALLLVLLGWGLKLRLGKPAQA